MTAKMPSLVAVLCGSLAACAGAPTHKPLPSDVLDEQKVVLVNQWAETHGARLIWIHYPTRNPSQSND
jgi:asparagine N-glycosylation enzyme membrane subunit Stt3